MKKLLALTLVLMSCSTLESVAFKQSFIDAKDKNYTESYETDLSFQDAVDCLVYRMATYTNLPNPDLSIIRNSPNQGAKLIGFYEVDGTNKNNVLIHSFTKMGNKGYSDIKHCISKWKNS